MGMRMGSGLLSVDPLATAMPRVVAAGPRDPAAEKRALADRLLIRRGGTLVAREEETLEQKLRSLGMEQDDEDDLQRLSSALSNLEQHAATKRAATSSSPVVAAAAASTSSGGSSGTFRLRIKLDGTKDPAELSFDAAGASDLPNRVADFVRQNGLRDDVFKAPLLERCRRMLETGQLEESADVVDLM